MSLTRPRARSHVLQFDFVTCARVPAFLADLAAVRRKGVLAGVADRIITGLPGRGDEQGSALLSLPHSKFVDAARALVSGCDGPTKEGQWVRGNLTTITKAMRLKVAGLASEAVAPPLRGLVRLVLAAGAHVAPLRDPTEATEPATVFEYIVTVGGHVPHVAACVLRQRAAMQQRGSGHWSGHNGAAQHLHKEGAHDPDILGLQSALDDPFAPDLSKRASKASTMRCSACRWKLCEEIEAPGIPTAVLEQLQASRHAGIALAEMVNELLRPVASIPALMTSAAASNIVAACACGNMQTVLALMHSHAPRLLAFFKPYHVHSAGTGQTASPLLGEVAFRVAQTRLLVRQQFAVHLQPPQTSVERIHLPRSYLPHVTGVLAFSGRGAGGGHYVTVYCAGSGAAELGDGVAEGGSRPQPRREVPAVPVLLHQRMKDAKIRPAVIKLHVTTSSFDNSGAGRGRVDAAEDASGGVTDHRKRKGDTTVGVCTFLCEHARILGTLPPSTMGGRLAASAPGPACLMLLLIGPLHFPTQVISRCDTARRAATSPDGSAGTCL